MNPELFGELQDKLIKFNQRLKLASLFIMDNAEEVKNDIGGVEGYKLELTPIQTRKLMSILNGL